MQRSFYEGKHGTLENFSHILFVSVELRDPRKIMFCYADNFKPIGCGTSNSFLIAVLDEFNK